MTTIHKTMNIGIVAALFLFGLTTEAQAFVSGISTGLERPAYPHSPLCG